MVITENLCTACGACVSICPKQCISIEKDRHGFYTTKIKSDQCIECKVCVKICPANTRKEGVNWTKSQFYACWAKDKKKRFSGSSGGIFGLLADDVISENGVVYGAAFSSDFKYVYQTSTEDVDIEQLKKSKYVESYMGNVFVKVKQNLIDGKKVLYCGSSCQIDGLKNYLNKDYDNLVTCDFLCHGVPSAGFYEKYINNLEDKYGSINSISFRSKYYGWKAYCIKADFKNKKYVKNRFSDPYLRTFFENIMIREACFSCKRLNESNADITIGDYWKVKNTPQIVDTNEGISLVSIHTNKGMKAFNHVSDSIEAYMLDKSNCEYAYNRSTKEPINRKQRIETLCNIDNVFDINVSLKTKIKGFLYTMRANTEKFKMKKK